MHLFFIQSLGQYAYERRVWKEYRAHHLERANLESRHQALPGIILMYRISRPCSLILILDDPCFRTHSFVTTDNGIFFSIMLIYFESFNVTAVASDQWRCRLADMMCQCLIYKHVKIETKSDHICSTSGSQLSSPTSSHGTARYMAGTMTPHVSP
jgi:hypothetical protein